MAKILTLHVSPVKYVPLNLDASADSIKLHDRYNFEFIQSSFESKHFYAQKWRKGITIRQQIWSQDVAIIYLQLVRCDGTEIAKVYRSAASLLGYLVNDVPWDINVFDIDTSNMQEEEFFILLAYGNTLETVKADRISERQEVVSDQQELLVFKYQHSYNEYNCVFKTSYNSFFNQTFYFCVEGRMHKHLPEGEYTEFDDQRKNRTLLSAKPYPTHEIEVGFGKVPSWVGDLLNMIRSCDTVTIDQYKLAFFDKWEAGDAKNSRRFSYKIRVAEAEINYSNQIDVCSPVNAQPLSLPDGRAGVQYYYVHQLNGSGPFSITASNLPLAGWLKVSIIDDQLIVQTLADAPPPVAVTDFPFSVTIKNACGEITLTDNLTIQLMSTCAAVAFTGNNILPQPTYNQSYLGFIELFGSTPYVLSNVSKPAWMTVVAGSSGIELSGTPNVAGTFTLSFTVQNCAGSGSAINFSQSFTVNSNVTITGYNTVFSIVTPAQSGQILAIPGTLVTVVLVATNFGTNNLIVTLTGATPSTPLNVTNGMVSATFVMPGSGFVAWSGTFTATSPLGTAIINVS